MAIQFNASGRNAILQAIETEIKGSAVVRFYTGAQPVSAGAADSGTRLATMQLPADYLGTPTSGTSDKSGTWSTTVSAAGVPGHFRMFNSAETVNYVQGAITSTAGAGDLKFDAIDWVTAQTVTINSWTFVAGNA
jgi:hypothetical protein